MYTDNQELRRHAEERRCMQASVGAPSGPLYVSNGGGANATTPYQPTLTDTYQELGASINSLEQALSVMLGKLQPVIRDIPDIEMADGPQPGAWTKVPRSQLQNNLHEQIARINQLRRVIQVHTEYVDL